MPATVTNLGPCACCGGITTACCPNPVPAVLFATITGGGIYDGTYPLIHRPAASPPTWTFTLDDGPIGTCPQGGTEAILILQCDDLDSVWKFYTDDFVFGPYLDPGVQCDPFLMVVTGVALTFCGIVSGATVTISA